MKKNLLAMTVMLCALFSAFQAKASFTILNYDTTGAIQVPPGMYHYEVLHFGISNTEGENIELESIEFEFSGLNPQALFSNTELHANNVQIASVIPALQNGTATFQFSSSVMIPAGQTKSFVLYADIQPGCNGGYYNVDIVDASAFRMISQSSMPVSGMGYETGSLISVAYTPTISIDGIPAQVCPNTPFTPHATITWNSASVCMDNLVYEWDFTWNSTVASAPTLTAPAIQFTNSGTYTITLQITDTVIHRSWHAFYPVQVSPLPNGYIQTTGYGQLNCLNDTVTLRATLQNVNSFYWDYNGTPMGSNLTILALQAGNYTLHTSNNNGCGTTEQSMVITRDTFGVQLLWNGDNVDTGLVCPGNSFSLHPFIVGTNWNSNTYEWSDGTSLTWLDNASGVGNYSVTVTNYLGCSVTDNITITERTVTPPTLTAQGPTQFCAGGSLLITATPGYQWHNWTGGYTSLSRDSILVMWDGEITLTAQDSFGCMVQSNTILVDVVNGPGTPTITQNGCELITNLTSNNLQWFVNNGQIIDSTQVIIPQMSGLYSVMVTDQFGCTSTSEQLAYSMPALPVISTNGSTQLCTGESVLLTVQPGFNFLWSNGATTQSILVNQPGTYTATVTNGTCIQTASPISVTVTNCDQSPSGQINLFYATPNNVCSGSSVNLTWATTNAISGQFSTDHPIGGNPFAFAFTQVVSVIVYQTTTFTLTIQDGNLHSHSQTIVVHVDTCTTTGTEEIDLEAAIKLYPNPTSSVITVENIPSGVERYSITSITGQVLTEATTNNAQQTTIDVSSFASGVYFLRLDNGTTKKFIKE